MTKREMIAALEAAGVKVGGKLNVVALTALMVEHKLLTAEGSDSDGSDDAAAAAQAEGDAAANNAEVEAPKPATREKVAGETVAVKSLKIEKNRETRNGITRPSIGGFCRAIWDRLDAIVASKQPLPTAKQLALTNGWNLSTVGRQSAEWRKFNGYSKKAADDATAE